MGTIILLILRLLLAHSSGVWILVYILVCLDPSWHTVQELTLYYLFATYDSSWHTVQELRIHY